jgi:hypothetical protein
MLSVVIAAAGIEPTLTYRRAVGCRRCRGVLADGERHDARVPRGEDVVLGLAQGRGSDAGDDARDVHVQPVSRVAPDLGRGAVGAVGELDVEVVHAADLVGGSGVVGQGAIINRLIIRDDVHHLRVMITLSVNRDRVQVLR